MVDTDGIKDEMLPGLDKAHFPVRSRREVVLHAGTGRGKLLDDIPLAHELCNYSDFRFHYFYFFLH